MLRGLFLAVAAAICVLLSHTDAEQQKGATGRRLLAEKNAETARRTMPVSDERCVEKAVCRALELLAAPQH